MSAVALAVPIRIDPLVAPVPVSSVRFPDVAVAFPLLIVRVPELDVPVPVALPLESVTPPVLVLATALAEVVRLSVPVPPAVTPRFAVDVTIGVVTDVETPRVPVTVAPAFVTLKKVVVPALF